MKTLTAQRNRAFADLCLRMADADLRHGRLVNVGVIVRRAIYTPAAGYYMSYNRALRLIYGCSDICRDEDGIGLQRAEALRRAVDKYRARHPQASIPRAVADVLADNGAPRYYFRPEQDTAFWPTKCVGVCATVSCPALRRCWPSPLRYACAEAKVGHIRQVKWPSGRHARRAYCSNTNFHKHQKS